MTANVRCAGRSTVGEPTPGNRTITKTPCGWKGERWADALLTEEQVRTIRPYSDQWYAAIDAADAELRTRKPCPRCGGRVQLIGEVER